MINSMDKDKLYRYFEGIASAEEMQEIRSWAEGNEEHEALLRRERKLFDAIILLGTPQEAGGREAAPGAGQTGRQESGHKVRSLKRKVRSMWRVAAIVLLTVGLTASLLEYVESKDPALSALQKISVPAGQRVHILLPDSSSVWLNSGSTLEYAAAFGRKQRVVKLDGEGYFDVRHQDGKPFVVHTPQADVTDLGTKFNVEAYSRTGSFVASLMEGKISVRSACGQIEIEPDEMVQLERGRLVRSRIEDYDVYRWREGLYCFRNKTFHEVMKDFEKYYDVKIVLDNPILSTHRLSGKFRFADGLDYALRVLQAEEHFTYTRNDEANEITIKK